MRLDKIPGHHPQGPFWQGFDWSWWYPLEDLVVPVRQLRLQPDDEEKGFTRSKALYRLRVGRRRGLFYIGETSISAQHRLRGHYRGMNRQRSRSTTQPMRRPLGLYKGLAQVRRRGLVVYASWTAVPSLSKSDRRGLEAELIAAYRATMGRNPDYQWPGADSDRDLGAW
jgi:hypothetical protein